MSKNVEKKEKVEKIVDKVKKSSTNDQLLQLAFLEGLKIGKLSSQKEKHNQSV